MKIFYFGSVCSAEVFNCTVEKSKTKPSASAQNFEMALLKGLTSIPDAEVTVVSAESIAMFPHGNRIYLKRRRDYLFDNVTTEILPALNLPLIKQKIHAYMASKKLRTWLIENRGNENKCVLLYGIYPVVAKELVNICRKHGCPIVAIITDIPSTMFSYTTTRSIVKRFLANPYRRIAADLQDKFDGYVFLTDAMSEEVAPGKPYVVVETIADCSIFDNIREEKSNPPALMYAGALYKKYGLNCILEAFSHVKSDSQLWLFGSGDYEDEIKRIAEKDKRVIFFGRVERDEILRKECQATLLLNLRNPDDAYTKYSFPSKMVEYMLSGTPVLTTDLPGIPAEYNEYSYVLQDRNPAVIAEKIENILLNGHNQPNVLGLKAREFICVEKNCYVQAEKIYRFMIDLTIKRIGEL